MSGNSRLLPKADRLLSAREQLSERTDPKDYSWAVFPLTEKAERSAHQSKKQKLRVSKAAGAASGH